MAIAKVIYKENDSATGEVWMDTTQKTVTSGSMLSGTTALKNDGTGITGNIASKSSSDLTVSGATVTAPAGYYASAASKSVASGSAGTPTASKGTVSNHSVSVTPSVTNTTGYITGGTKTGTAVTVSASELVSGSETKTTNGTYDVTNLAQVVVNVGGGTPNIQSLNVTQNGTYTASGGVDGYSPVTVSVSGGASPKMAIMRPDAELVKSWTYDKLAVQDLGYTIPAYTTTAKTVLASASLDSYSWDLGTYFYAWNARGLAVPIYSTNDIGAGRNAFYAYAAYAEYLYYGNGAIHVGNTGNTSVISSTYTGTSSLVVYYTSASAIGVSTSATSKYGVYMDSGILNTINSSTFTPKSPNLYLRGSSTYLSETYWNALTDIRYQYIIELWRIPKSSSVSGYNVVSQTNHVISCFNGNGTLT